MLLAAHGNSEPKADIQAELSGSKRSQTISAPSSRSSFGKVLRCGIPGADVAVALEAMGLDFF